MYKGLKIAAVVPAHNEEKQILDVINGMPNTVDFICITDDLSSDATYNVVSNSDDPRVHLVKHTKNTGVGGAIITAHKTAINLGSDINVVFAGDNQMDPKYLPNLLDPIIDGFHGYAKGNRLFSKNSTEGMPRYRIYGNKILTILNKAASGYWKISDPQNGYTAIRTDILNEINYETIAKGYEFENDMLTRLNENNIPVIDIAIPANYGNEVSGIKLSKVIPQLLKYFISAFVRRMFKKFVLKMKIIPTTVMFFLILNLGALIYSVVILDIYMTIIESFTLVILFSILSIYDYQNSPDKWKVSRSFTKSNFIS